MKLKIDDEEYVDLEEVMKITGLKQSNLYIKMKYNEFPKSEKKPISKTVTFVKKHALWKLSEIEEYIESQRK